MKKRRTVKYIVGVDISQNPIVVVHIVADDGEKPRYSREGRAPKVIKRAHESDPRKGARKRESKRNWRSVGIKVIQIRAEEPVETVQVVRSFDNGKILVVKEFPRIKVSLPGVSFLIMKTNKGYLFRGMNGNTVGAGYWGLTGDDIYENTGHHGQYIFSDGSGGCMDGLSGALAVCRSSFDDAYIVRPGFHDDYFSRVVGDDIEAMLKELEQVINLADDRPLIG